LEGGEFEGPGGRNMVNGTSQLRSLSYGIM
jgi:hypothetical protein